MGPFNSNIKNEKLKINSGLIRDYFAEAEGSQKQEGL
jgi:hypothetical protein